MHLELAHIKVSARPSPVDSTIGICSFARDRYKRLQAKNTFSDPTTVKTVWTAGKAKEWTNKCS